MKVSTKISLMGMASVAFCALALVVIVLLQKTSSRQQMEALIRGQVRAEAGQLAQSVYFTCAGSDARTRRQLDYNLDLARTTLEKQGGVTLGSDTVSWQAVNQFTKQAISATIPKLLLGGKWLEQNTKTNVPSLLVDDLRLWTGGHVTLFQRLNDEGDMLRVCTSVVGLDGERAIGTFIPRRMADGTDNPVISATLRGERFVGRAFVVSSYYTTAYEPLWDADRKKVIGMLFVGIDLKDALRDARQTVLAQKVGKTGYVFVLGGKGDQRGKYIVSKDGARDAESIWESRDADGRLCIQSMVQKALATTNGSVAFEEYAWKNTNEASSRRKVAALTYYEPWDWIIGAGTYEDDYRHLTATVSQVLNRLVFWVLVAATVVLTVSFFVSVFVSRSITRPMERLITLLNGTAAQFADASAHISLSSQSLAEGASEQAASLEETSSSLEEMSSMTQRNAANARQANELAKAARAAADRGAADMTAMTEAMHAIKTSSDNIAKILKTIDEIAFQTNLLALNAAVEAARAGEAGAGFAVVADEVRSLAQRAAAAAKETAEKIEGAIGKSAQGVEISNKVAAALGDILTKARQVDELVAEVAGASREQSQGIGQINTAVNQMDKVTQSNAANAEESAAAAEELNAQAESLRAAVRELEQLLGGTVAVSAPVATKPQSPSPSRPDANPSFGNVRQSHGAASRATVPAVIQSPPPSP